MKPLTVLHLHNSHTVGGVEISLVGWLRNFDRERVSPKLFCFEEADGAEHAFMEYLRRRNMVASLLPWGRRKRLIAAVNQLIGVIRVSRPCIVHTHDMRPDLVGWLAARASGCPLIATNHGWHSIWPGIGVKRRRNDALRARFLKGVDLQIAVAESIRQESIRRGSDPARVITLYTGIDLKEFQPSVNRDAVRQRLGFGQTDIVIGNVARLYPEKAQKLLVEAFACVSRQAPRARLLIVGNGPLLEPLRADADRLGISSRVTFCGFQDDIASLFSALDVFALPSFAEGMPLVIYKAMAAGLPIVASDVAGVGELLKHGETALLVGPGDVAALAGSLLLLAGDEPDCRRFFGQRARETAATDSRYSIVTSTRRLEALYETLAAQRGERLCVKRS